MSVTGESSSPPVTFAFRTKKGVRGLLQITGFTDNPPGVKLRYKLVEHAGVKPVTTPPSEPADPRLLHFGPVIEREICFSTVLDRTDRILDMDSGQFITPPAELAQHFAKGAWIGCYSGIESKESGDAMKAWARAGGADLHADGWQERLTLPGSVR